MPILLDTFVLIHAFILRLFFSSKGQAEADTLEGWWTLLEGKHYFEDEITQPIEFVGEDLWGMDAYYEAMVPQLGLPVQVIITTIQKENYLEVYTLMPSRSCEASESIKEMR